MNKVYPTNQFQITLTLKTILKKLFATNYHLRTGFKSVFPPVGKGFISSEASLQVIFFSPYLPFPSQYVSLSNKSITYKNESTYFKTKNTD